MKNAISILLVIVIGCIFWNFSSRPEMKTVAIIPFEVTYDGSHFDTSVESLDTAEEQAGYGYQSDFYHWIVDSKRNYSAIFQDADSTDSILTRENLTYKDILLKDKGNLCKMLGVDELIAGTAVVSKPWSGRTLTVANIFIGSTERNTKIKATINIYDTRNMLICNYKRTIIDSTATSEGSQSSVAEKFMKKCTRKLPFPIR